MDLGDAKDYGKEKGVMEYYELILQFHSEFEIYIFYFLLLFQFSWPNRD